MTILRRIGGASSQRRHYYMYATSAGVDAKANTRPSDVNNRNDDVGCDPDEYRLLVIASSEIPSRTHQSAAACRQLALRLPRDVDRDRRSNWVMKKESTGRAPIKHEHRRWRGQLSWRRHQRPGAEQDGNTRKWRVSVIVPVLPHSEAPLTSVKGPAPTKFSLCLTF